MIDVAPDITHDIYVFVFSYKEYSKEPTEFGTPVMPLISNRRQDYEMFFYLLNKHFLKFLQKHPYTALKTSLICVNKEIQREHLDHKRKINEEKFEFNDITAKIIFDYSYIWNQRSHLSKYSIKIAEKLFDHIISETNSLDISKIINLWASHAQVAYLWKNLIKIATKKPKKFSKHIISLVTNKNILVSSEMDYDIGNFLKIAFVVYTGIDRKLIEKAILSLPHNETNSDKIKYFTQNRNMYLSNLPKELLTCEESKTILKELSRDDKSYKLKPHVSFSVHSSEYSEEDHFREQGVDLSNEQNNEIFELSKKLKNMEKNINDNFELSKIEKSIIIDLEEAFKKYNSTIKNELKLSLFINLCNYVTALSLKIEDADSELFKLSKTILTEAAKHQEPVYNPKYHTNLEFPSWSPSPRTEAIQGLSRLSIRRFDKEIIESIELLSRDKVPAVRYLASVELFRLYWCDKDSFWRIICNFSKEESQFEIIEGLLQSVFIIIKKDEDVNRCVLLP